MTMGLFTRKQSRARLDHVLHGQEPPVFPQHVMRILRMLRDPDTDAREIAAALNWDPRLVVRLLRTVNSAAFGTAREIDSVPHAVALLGRSQLEQLVLGVAVKECLPRSPARGFEPGRFWQAAFFRAALASTLADRLHPAEQSRSFTGALLQDMAVPLLAHARPDDYGPLLEAWHDSPGSQLHALERDALGWSHAEIGAHLGQAWELPESFVSLIQRHHDDDASDRELPPALRLVGLHRESEQGQGLDDLVEQGRSMYGIEPDWMREAVGTSEAQALELARALG
jgi:HD-like signal output (HDOD) protein